MQNTGINNEATFKSTLSKEDDKLLVDFFALLLQWEIENDRIKTQESQKIQAPL